MFHVTEEQVATIGQTKIGPIVRGFCKVLNARGDEFGVNTYLRVCHFIGQCAEESDHFNTTTEYASGAAYEGRKDLGNTQRGDGKRFKGRGVIQITGRYNYTRAGRALGLDLVDDPELAADPEVGTLIALWYWKDAGVNKWSDRDDARGETRRINGGYTNLSTRQMFIERAKAVLRDASVEAPVIIPPPKPPPDDPVPVIDAESPEPANPAPRGGFFVAATIIGGLLLASAAKLLHLF